MNAEVYIGAGAVLVAILGTLFAFHRHKLSAYNKASDDRMKMQNQINNNALKIIIIEKDIVELRSKIISDMKELRSEFSKSMVELANQNRDDHRNITDRLDVAVESVVRAATLIETHVNNCNNKT